MFFIILLYALKFAESCSVRLHVDSCKLQLPGFESQIECKDNVYNILEKFRLIVCKTVNHYTPRNCASRKPITRGFIPVYFLWLCTCRYWPYKCVLMTAFFFVPPIINGIKMTPSINHFAKVASIYWWWWKLELQLLASNVNSLSLN